MSTYIKRDKILATLQYAAMFSGAERIDSLFLYEMFVLTRVLQPNTPHRS